jgi:cytochrome c oxidase cbb3-type subunit 3
MARIPDELLPHESDGIQEYDNPLPRWWLFLFYASIAWAVLYFMHFHVSGDWSSAQRYEAEMAAALERYGSREAPSGTNLADAVADPANAAKGAEHFATFCASCHQADGTGGIGPDLTDAEWIHGFGEGDLVQVVTEGVPAKGMVAWGPVLGPEKIVEVVAYVASLGGVEKAKAAGGAEPLDDPEDPDEGEGPHEDAEPDDGDPEEPDEEEGSEEGLDPDDGGR